MTEREKLTHDSLNTVTRSAAALPSRAADSLVPVLTVLAHPDVERVGEQVVLSDLLAGKAVRLSRLEPRFAPLRAGTLSPLADAHLSRRPLSLESGENGAVTLDASATKMRVQVNGTALESRRELSELMLRQGVVLVLAGNVALVLRSQSLEAPVACAPKLIGESAAMTRLRREIQRVADLEFPVLIRGESGTGKELVARAIHESGPRRDRPYLALNMGAIPRELAAAELFGAAKGAYTGAHRPRQGFFQRAHAGTLFLDEMGAAPEEIQVMLLRSLETGQVQSVGAEQATDVDVRIVSATDADLESAIAAGEFRSPLLHRLAAYEIELPPLRDRIDDFGRLFFHFLRTELATMGDLDRLEPRSDREPWVPADLVARLALYHWPGNVRQLGNVVRQLAVGSRGEDRLGVTSSVERLLRPQSPTSAESEEPSTSQKYRHPMEVSEDELLEALRLEGFNVSRTADRLGLSRTATYKLVDQCPRVRKASQLTAEEIERAGEHKAWELDAMAAMLEVSPHGLRLRIKNAGLGR